MSKIRQTLGILSGMGTRILILEGGEPFLWKDKHYTIYDVVREAKKYFFSVGMTTNGTFKLDIPTDVLWVSIDGPEKIHDSIRGVSYKRIIDNIKQSSHPNLLANITINKINYQKVGKIIRYLSGMVKGITIQFHYPYTGDTTLCLPPEKRRKLLTALIELKKKGYPLVNSYRCLKALAEGKWKCEDWMLANVEPDGKINFGCYVNNRGTIHCNLCGFAAHTEISFAFHLKIQSLFVGMRVFQYRNLRTQHLH